MFFFFLCSLDDNCVFGEYPAFFNDISSPRHPQSLEMWRERWMLHFSSSPLRVGFLYELVPHFDATSTGIVASQGRGAGVSFAAPHAACGA